MCVQIDDLTDQLVAAINQRREASHWELEQRAGPIEQFLERNKCALEASLSRARSSSQGVAPQRECLDVEVFEVSQVRLTLRPLASPARIIN